MPHTSARIAPAGPATLAFLAALTLGAACAAPLAAASADPAAAVRAVAEEIIAADNARDLARVLACYAEDAVLMPPNETPVHGKPMIRPRYEALFAQFAPAIEGRIDEIRVDRDWAFASGVNGGRLVPRGGGEARTLNDAWLMVLHREGAAGWKIARLIWHPAGPAATTKADDAGARR